MNFFGFSIDGLDVLVFATAVRVLFVALVLLGAAIAARRRNDVSGIVLGIAILGFALAWISTMYPLPNVYGANGSQDRENHLGWANVVAQGFSPLRTFQVHHLHFEPLWPLLTAVASGFNASRVELVFQWAPLVIGLLLACSISFAWTRAQKTSSELGVEAAFAALGALLLIAVPGDADGIFRNPWALTFLLKPNHVLGLVFVPLAALALARATGWKSRLLAGLVLQMIGWAFVLHMALFVAGLAVFVALSWMTRREERTRDLLDTVTAIGANVLLVSPYLYMLVTAYPFLHGSSHYRLSFFSDRAFEGQLRFGVFALISGWGAWNTYRRGGRFDRIMASQWLTGQIVWQAFPLLGFAGQAREQDEAFYWCRFWMGLFAAVGVFQIVSACKQRLSRWSLAREGNGVASSAALSLVLLLPALLPTWWDPSTMDQYFVAARKPIPDWIEDPNRFIRANTPASAVFVSDRNYARWIAAYGRRRVLLANSMNRPNDYPRRQALEAALLHDGPPDAVAEGMTRYEVQYLLVTSTPMEGDPAIPVARLRTYKTLEVVYDRTFPTNTVTIFKIHGERAQ